MPDLTPITREEMFLDGNTELTPITREEKILAGEDIDVITRREWFLKKYRSGGDITVESITITENGTTTAPSGKAYSPIYTNVGLPDNAYLLKDIENTPCDIATFTDGSALPMPSLKVGIEPIQSGSGDPSPTNVRPISGWGAVNRYRRGKNLFDKNSIVADKGYTSSTHSYNSTQGISTGFVNVKVGSTVTISGMKNWGIAYENCFVDKNKNYISTVGSRTGVGGFAEPVTVTVPNNAVYLAMAVYTGSSDYERYQDKDTIQVEVGNEVTTYENYNSNSTTYTTQLKDGQGNPLVCYGGQLVNENGVQRLDNTDDAVDMGDLNWTYSNGFFRTSDLNSIIKKPANNYEIVNAISSMYVAKSWNAISSTDNGKFAVSAGANDPLIVCNTDYTDATAFKTAMAGQKIKYELATPTQIPQDNLLIASQSGTNNMWADCGQITEGSYFSQSEEE